MSSRTSSRIRPSAYGVPILDIVELIPPVSGRRNLRVYWGGVHPGNALMYPSANAEGVRVGEVCDVLRNGNGRILALRRPTEEEKRTFQCPVFIEVEMAGDEDAAYIAIDAIMQSAWDRTQGGTTIGGPKWHFTMIPGSVSEEASEHAEIDACDFCHLPEHRHPVDGCPGFEPEVVPGGDR